jgi:hypothetical protein
VFKTLRSPTEPPIQNFIRSWSSDITALPAKQNNYKCYITVILAVIMTSLDHKVIGKFLEPGYLAGFYNVTTFLTFSWNFGIEKTYIKI